MIRWLLLLFLVVAPSSAVFACQCARRPSVEEAAKTSPLVITGVVLGHYPAALSREQFQESAGADMPRWFPVTKVEIGVTRVYKGDPPETIVLTHIGCCVCEQALEDGKEYALFVQPSWNVRHGLMVSFCDPNTEIARDRSVLDRLGSTRRVQARDSFNTTAGEALGHGVDRVRNLAVRIYLSRVSPNPWVRDPLEGIVQSPWYGFSKVLGIGVVLGVVVVVLRRRLRRSHGA